MEPSIIVELLIGAGIVNFLWKIQRELGEINSSLDNLTHIVDDHEQRIRNIEGNS